VRVCAKCGERFAEFWGKDCKAVDESFVGAADESLRSYEKCYDAAEESSEV
jgi:hypothetical protein